MRGLVVVLVAGVGAAKVLDHALPAERRRELATDALEQFLCDLEMAKARARMRVYQLRRQVLAEVERYR
jgi:hypothetical protein